MAHENATSKILIIGAGPGGLALAQMLRARDIPFEIFERDHTLTSRKQGWAVALVECLPVLEKLLPKDIGDLSTVSVNYGLAPFDGMCLMNGVTGEVIARLGVPRGQPGFVLRANREHFRQHLLQNLPISLGKSFDHYTQDRNGVVAFFKDGTSVRGSMLIGADGSHSSVRRQLLGPEAAAMVQSRYIPIISETILTRKQYEPIHNLGSSGILANKKDLRFMVGMLEALDNGDRARYYSATCYGMRDIEAAAAEAAWASSASKIELYEKALEVTKDVPAHITEITRLAGPESIATPGISFEEFVTPLALPRGRVTLLGDAAHTMVPFRGAGANTALNDACTMAEMLIAENERRGDGILDVHHVLMEYERIMLPRGRSMVLASRAAGDDVMGPVAGRTNLLYRKS